jgi:hypothetical protein
MKMLKKVFGSKRAFSAVIASLILMLLAVAAGVVVYAYVMGWIGGQTQVSQRTGKMSFDSIYANASTIRMYVRNVGGGDLLVAKIYVDGVEKENNTIQIPAAGYSLPVQSSVYLEVSNSMTADYFYKVDISCKDGTALSQSVQAK